MKRKKLNNHCFLLHSTVLVDRNGVGGRTCACVCLCVLAWQLGLFRISCFAVCDTLSTVVRREWNMTFFLRRPIISHTIREYPWIQFSIPTSIAHLSIQFLRLRRQMENGFSCIQLFVTKKKRNILKRVFGLLLALLCMQKRVSIFGGIFRRSFFLQYFVVCWQTHLHNYYYCVRLLAGCSCETYNACLWLCVCVCVYLRLCAIKRGSTDILFIYFAWNLLIHWLGSVCSGDGDSCKPSAGFRNL